MLLIHCVTCHTRGVQLFKIGKGYICKDCRKKLLNGDRVYVKGRGGWLKMINNEVVYIPPSPPVEEEVNPEDLPENVVITKEGEECL